MTDFQPLWRPKTVVESMASALQTYGPPDRNPAIMKAIGEGLVGRWPDLDAGQREILLALVAEAATNREDLNAVYARLGRTLDPECRVGPRLGADRQRANEVFTALHVSSPAMKDDPSKAFGGLIMTAVIEDGRTLDDLARATALQGGAGKAGGTSGFEALRLDLQALDQWLAQNAGHCPMSYEPAFKGDYKADAYAHVEGATMGARAGRDPVAVSVDATDPMPLRHPTLEPVAPAPGASYSASATGLQRLSIPRDPGRQREGVPPLSVGDLEHFTAQVKAEPARFGVASANAFGDFVSLYRSTDEVKTKQLVKMVCSLEVALGIRLDANGVKALKEALSSEPRLALPELINKFSKAPPYPQVTKADSATA